MYEPGRQIVHVVGEAALRTRIGGMSVATLRGQLTHLVEMSELPGHTFGVIPFSVVTPFTPAVRVGDVRPRPSSSSKTLDGSLQLTDPRCAGPVFAVAGPTARGSPDGNRGGGVLSRGRRLAGRLSTEVRR